MVLRTSLLRLILAGFLLSSTAAFYLPGAAPRNYLSGDRVPLLVNTLTPQIAVGTSQLKSLIS